jgi:hypothetical protein
MVDFAAIISRGVICFAVCFLSKCDTVIQHVWGLSLPPGFPEGVLSINNHSTLKTGGSRSMLCLLVSKPPENNSPSVRIIMRWNI